MATPQEIESYLQSLGLAVMPRWRARLLRAVQGGNGSGGGGAAFTGVQAGCYELGRGPVTICVNGKGQILSITALLPPPPPPPPG